MIVIFCALFKEAKSLIDHYNLKLESKYKHFQVFVSDDISLVVTGVGRNNMAQAVGFAMASLENISFAINIGVCAGEKVGDAFVINSIYEDSTSRFFYPDLVLKTELPESKLVTLDKVSTELSGNSIFDMEGSAFFDACSSFLAPSNIALFKVVSDSNGKINDPESIVDLIAKNINVFDAYIESIHLNFSSNTSTINEDKLLSLFEYYSEELKLSEYMRIELLRMLRFSMLSGIDICDEIDKFLPVESRREGKKVLDELYKRFI